MKPRGWRQLIELCRHAHSDEELEKLFELLFTLDEQEQLATRVELLRALLKGDNPQRTIAEQLNVSIAKITRGSNALKTISPQLRQFLLEQLK
jgi:TrpR family transcriptional regulator, trp operon repressor